MYSTHFQYWIPIWECLKLEPRTLKIKTKIFTPNTVYRLTVLPNKNMKEEILIACVPELLNEKKYY